MGLYHAVLNSELANTLNVEKTGNFLIRRLLQTYSHIITHVMYRSEKYGLHSRHYLNFDSENFQQAYNSFQVHDTTMFN